MTVLPPLLFLESYLSNPKVIANRLTGELGCTSSSYPANIADLKGKIYFFLSYSNAFIVCFSIFQFKSGMGQRLVKNCLIYTPVCSSINICTVPWIPIPRYRSP